jgi:hypothetical protein
MPSEASHMQEFVRIIAMMIASSGIKIGTSIYDISIVAH